MASINIPLFLQIHAPKIALVLIFTVLEWTLITSLFLNCSFFFLITKYAYFCGLRSPCISCSLSAFKISFGDLLCNDHAKGFNNIIYGSPWKVVKYANNGDVVHKRIKRESETECRFLVKEGHHKPDCVEDKSSENMQNRCIIQEERLVPVELIDEVTIQDSSTWFIAEQHHKRDSTGRSSILQAVDGKTKLRKDDSRDSISYVEDYYPRKDQVGFSIHKTTDQNQNMRSYSSLSEIIPIEATPLSEPSSPKVNVFYEQKANKFSSSSKSLDSSMVERNKEKTYRGVSHSQSIFEITPIETTSFVNPDVASNSISEKLDELDASVKEEEEELKSEILNKLDESLEKFEEERCSVTENLNQLEQRALTAKEEVLASKNVIEEEKPNFEKGYRSLSEFLNCDMNYSTNDLVNLGKVHDQRKDKNLKKNRFQQPSLKYSNLKKSVDQNSLQARKFDDEMNEHEKLATKEETDNLYERLKCINEARELIKQCVNSL